jgi:ribose transport system substrate-binding protein
MLADWVTVQSNGKAHVLVVGANSLPALGVVRQGFDRELAAVCGSCTLSTIQLTIDQIFNNEGAPVVVSALQRSPGIDYVALVNGALLDGLSTSLTADGMAGKVTITSAYGDVQNQTNVLSGREGATTAIASEIQGWLIVDAALRHMEGMSYPADFGNGPMQLFHQVECVLVEGWQ